MDPAQLAKELPIRCPACKGFSGKVYRCTKCGHDLAGDGSTAGRQQ